MSMNLTTRELEFRQQDNNRLEAIYKREQNRTYLSRKAIVNKRVKSDQLQSTT